MADDFINLDKIVRDWAWANYDKTTTTSKQKKLRQKDRKEPGKYLRLEVDWSEAKFVDQTEWQPLCYEQNITTPTNAASATGTDDAAAGPVSVRKRDLASSSEPIGSILFQTRFTNNTRAPQEYTMKTERKTKTTMSTSVENGFTRGVEMSVKLAAPAELFELNAGYQREVTLTRAESQTFEEELTWGVDSTIRVEEGHVAEASLVVDERKQSGDFSITTRVRGPVYVTFTSPIDNNSLVKTSCNDIADIVERTFLKGKSISFVRVEKDTDTVVIVTKGKSHFRYGIKQEIRVDQKKIE